MARMATGAGRKRTRDEFQESESDGAINFTERHFSDRSSRYVDERLSIDAWSKLNDQRLEGRLCDVILVTEEGAKENAHRCVLAASSDYFSRMFEQTGFVDSQKQEIQLHDVPGAVLTVILNCMYTGSLELTTENVHAVVSACDYLLYPVVRQSCVMFMSRILDSDMGSEEVLKIVTTAERFEFDDLRLQAWEVICKNFDKIYTSKNFKELSLPEMKQILDVNGHYVSEESVWWAAHDWLADNSEERKKHLDEVMDCVRFPLLETETLMDVVKPLELIQESSHVKSLVDDAILYKMFPLRQSKMQTTKTKPRADIINGVFCLVGIESFYVYMPKIKTWYSLACPFPLELTNEESENFSYHLVLADTRIFAIGKVRSRCETGRYMVECIQAYDPKFNAWTKVPLPFRCENTIFIECKKTLYACSRSAIEVYDVSEDSWNLLFQHVFNPFDFIYAQKGQLYCYDFASGTRVLLDVERATFRNERITPVPTIGPVKGIAPYGKGKLLVTSKSAPGYSRKFLDTNTLQFMPATPFCKSPWAYYGHDHQEYPLCLDPDQFWHIHTSKGAAWVMASHPAILGKPTKDRSVNDGVIPFFSVSQGGWERLPSIPEQPNKPISLCTLRGRAGTTVACSY